MSVRSELCIPSYKSTEELQNISDLIEGDRLNKLKLPASIYLSDAGMLHSQLYSKVSS